LPFPSTETDTYGLIQEQLTDKPLFMLIANMLLNRTNGKQAIPKFWELVEKYPTVDDLVAADLVELTEMIRPLGLQSRRALSIITLARFWLTNPPVKGRRYRKMNYPSKGAHLDIRPGEILSDEDPRVAAFEVCHLTNVGDYALDSWRIFCRDQLRGCASGFNGEDAEPGFEPEWKRVRASDKELQGFLRWMWIREGWIYDPVTGEKRRASEDEEEAAKI
ncbi:DNA glycosylase, partial [Phyllosticta citriasiana]